MNWLIPNTIYLTLGGSHAYGLNTHLSDIDVCGICIPPIEIENDLFHTFEQTENNIDITTKLEHLRNPKNPKIESVVYSLKKFIKLAAAVNPNVIELLYVDPRYHAIKHPIMEKLLESRTLFISARAKFTFSGYAFSALGKLERHRKWLICGPIKQPTRNDYGLPEEPQKEVEDAFRYIKRKVEEWNLSELPLDENEKGKLKELTWEVINEVSNKKVNWENWINAYTSAAINKLSESFNLKEEIVDLIRRENQYRRDLQSYHSWSHWKENRNPARKEMEIKYSMDTKHASQLIRLLRMGLEIIEKGEIIVNRPDAEELLAIKNGSWSYEKVIEYAEEMNKKLDEAYKVTKLPRSVNYVKINELYHELITERRSLNS